MQYDLVIVGGGPAAIAAAVYAARKQLKTALVAAEIGGQSAVSEKIFNWIGTPEISGTALAQNLRQHAEDYALDKGTLALMVGKSVQKIAQGEDGIFSVITDGDTLKARAVLVASGSRRRKLEVPGAEQFEANGVMYCATCDGPLFSGQRVAVVGGGNAGFEAAAQLSQYASHVTLLNRTEVFKADEITINHVLKDPKVEVIKNAQVTKIEGGRFVERLYYKVLDGQEIELPVGGIFVEIGQLPNTEIVEGLVAMDEYRRIKVDPLRQRASVPGIWAAGDCTDGLYHQNNIAAGDAVKAIEDLYLWLKTGK